MEDKVRLTWLVLLAVPFSFSGLAHAAEYLSFKSRAEALYAEHSYAEAHDLYQEIREQELAGADRRWLDFRLADTLWRSQGSTRQVDPSLIEQARRQLKRLLDGRQRPEERDGVWAEAQESLGDSYWNDQTGRHWSQAWSHYQPALEWWAGSTDLDHARQRYLSIIWNITRNWEERSAYYYFRQFPLRFLENAVEIAEAAKDRAHAHYLLAMALRQQHGNWPQRRRVAEQFEAVLALGEDTDRFDDALYHYAQWLHQQGPVTVDENGRWKQTPDFSRALELYRRLTSEFGAGESRYLDDARAQIEEIIGPELQLHVGHIFLPESEIEVQLTWRNLNRVDLALYAVSLPRDVQFSQPGTEHDEWLQTIDLSARQTLKEWSRELTVPDEYQQGQEKLRLDSLAQGAYVLEGWSRDQRARELVLVTESGLVLKASGGKALVYYCDEKNGSPMPDADVVLWERYRDHNRWYWRRHDQTTGEDGLAAFDLTHTEDRLELFAGAKHGDSQAFSLQRNYFNRRRDQEWKLYALSDRPVYRPEETVQWKLIARTTDGTEYSTPANRTLRYEIRDPRGGMVKEGTLTLNHFGSAWGELKLTAEMPLGEYLIQFHEGANPSDGGGFGPNERPLRKPEPSPIGAVRLFRLEEYKLPEFKVSVEVPEEEKGKPKAYRLGDEVEVTIQADYYFGGPVVNATVETIVYQSPLHRVFQPEREFPWYYEDISPRYGRHRGGRGDEVKRETLTTDAQGRATLTFETPDNPRQDLEYRIEARVTDASRREVTGSDTVRVTGQSYYAHLKPEHQLYQPQDQVAVNVRTADANDQPVSVSGRVTITRKQWREIWINPQGDEVEGAALQDVRRKHRIFPPPPDDDGDGRWRLKSRGYETEEILQRSVQTDDQGEVRLTFAPARVGYYQVQWRSKDRVEPPVPIEAETTVWVTDEDSTEIGYRHGGVQIIVDKETFEAGTVAPVMLTVPAADRYVLFTIEGEELQEYRLVHVPGTVKLLELPIRESHVPNIFLSAAMVSDHQLYADQQQVVVPPRKQFLNVKLETDRDMYQPQQNGTITVTTRNHKGEPISAEVALGLSDESLTYIQQDYAGDPRQFFYGDKRQLRVRTESTFHYRSYARLVENEEGLLEEETAMLQRRRESRLRRELAGMEETYPRERGRSSVYDNYNRYGLAKGATGGGFGGGGYAMREGLSVPEMQVGTRLRAAGEPASAALGRRATLDFSMAQTSAERFDSELSTGTPRSSAPDVEVRSDFRSTVFWQPDIVTGADGRAKVQVQYPDSLTGWEGKARVVTSANQFGIAEVQTRTRKPLIVRLQAPRFFLVGDKVTVSAVINNNTDSPMEVASQLTARGLKLLDAEPRDGSSVARGETQRIKPRKEIRVDWRVEVTEAGDAELEVKAWSRNHADAMAKTYPVYEHGLSKLIAKSGKLNRDRATIALDLPKQRNPGTTEMTVQVTPSLAMTMLDALPYLIHYPYGCTEQTMSRFLPAAITAETLRQLDLKPDSVMGRAFGGIESGAGATHPAGKGNLDRLEEVIYRGLDRLYDFQHADGGWGWWKEDDSDRFMTAYVVWGMTLARQSGIDIRIPALNQAVNYLIRNLVEEETRLDRQAWMLHAVAVHHQAEGLDQVAELSAQAFDNLWQQREQLNAYSRALLTLAAHAFGYTEKAEVLVRNLENGVIQDASPGSSVLQRDNPDPKSTDRATAHWGEDGIYRRWSEGGVEATAFALRALLAVDPDHALIEPAANWLIKNRRGAQWSNTRDTAIVVLTLNDYLRKSGELTTDIDYEVRVNDREVAAQKLSGADVFQAPSRFRVKNEWLRNGENRIEIQRRSGNNPIYFSVEAEFFSLEEPVPPEGNELFVHRQYYKLVPRRTLLKGYQYEKVHLKEGTVLRSGDRVESVVTVETKNHYEYLVLEDLKPSGLEAVEVRSGQNLRARQLKAAAITAESGKPQVDAGGDERSPMDYTGAQEPVYQELRDRKMALFINRLPEGYWEIRCTFRAEVPGEFHALPVAGHAMYVPEIRANSGELPLTIHPEANQPE